MSNTPAFTDRSGSITAGGTSQQLAAANPYRTRLIVQNPVSATESLFINFGSAASTSAGTSIELAPGGSYTTPGGHAESTEAVNVVATTTSHKFTAKEM